MARNARIRETSNAILHPRIKPLIENLLLDFVESVMVVKPMKNDVFEASKFLMKELPNGERYPRVGGTRQRHFAGTSLEPHKMLENAATPTRRVHAVLGGLIP